LRFYAGLNGFHAVSVKLQIPAEQLSGFPMIVHDENPHDNQPIING